MTTTYRDVVERLNEQDIAHREVQLADGSIVVVSAYGGRIYGPFRSADAESEAWLPEAFADREAFAALVASGFWNVGGERLWIGPEIAYMIVDRDDYWGSYTMPVAIDPAVHEFTGVQARMSRSGTVLARHLASGEVRVDVDIEVLPAPSPLRHLSDAAPARAARCAGYTERVALTQDGLLDAPVESWNLVQVRGGGRAIIPAVPRVEVTDYYEPVGHFLRRHPTAVTAEMTGAHRYKIGFKAPHVHGRAGHLRRTGEHEYVLLVRQFANDPAAPYSEEPDFAPGVLGDSIHIYNDDGGLGGFGEVEARGRTTGYGTGRTTSVDEFTSWWFFGTREQIDDVAGHLLGVSLAELGA